MQLRMFLFGVIVLGLLSACSSDESTATAEAPDTATLVRPHSPVLGPVDAPVTLVEFFDPSCEGCRAFYPFVKDILAEYPEDVRLVLRYVPFHGGSEQAVGILEAARMQGLYVAVLEAVLAVQPQWHNDPKLAAAWQAAGEAGLQLDDAREQAKAASITQNLATDMKDAMAYKVTRTPTFFVNGKVVEPFGREQLYQQVSQAVAQAQDR